MEADILSNSIRSQSLEKSMSKDVSDEDKALFRALVGKVKPLKKEKIASHKSEKNSAHIFPRKVRDLENTLPSNPILKPRPLSDFIPAEVSSNTMLSYSIAGFPSMRFKDLKNGKIRWQAKLDLHGYKQESVAKKLTQFIDQHTQQGTRCVLIVHGRGGQHGTPPVLKNLINRYLPQFEEVLAFHSALPKDGGLGAVYVFLKRNTVHIR